MTTRNWPIHRKIIALIAVPLTALLALWIFATTLTAGPAFHLLSAHTRLDTVADPGQALIAELQQERRMSVEFLSTPESSPSALAAQRAVTDRAIARFRGTALSGDDQAATVRMRIRQMVAGLDGLSSNRQRIDRREGTPIAAQRQYDTVIDTGYELLSATATFGDEGLDREARALVAVGRGQEYLSRADSLLASANAAGRFTEDVRAELVGVLGAARFLLTDAARDLSAPYRAAYQQLTADTAVSELDRLQGTLIEQSRTGAPAPVPSTSWQPAYDTSAQELRAFESNATDALADRAHTQAVGALIRLGVAGAVGLLALIVSIVIAIRVGRSIVGRLARLRGEALEIANQRLPTAVRRLQRGEAVDVEVETPPLQYGSDEIGQVGEAFTQVQHAAVQSAVEEARVRRGINDVFLNIARRGQALLHRQLALLDRMERRETTPDKLEDLYRVDHLATRMRRHAEDLVILAGAVPGRGWRNPVRVVDVVRGAISEVEDYKRIDIRSVESSAVLGRAVGDIIHLLAELLENAAAFSPPHTHVEVTGQVLPSGYAIEVEDRGRGMTSDALDEANRKLSELPDLDPADNARLGLFLAAQLAGRHGIRIRLRPSAFGGITATVLIPGDLVTVNAEPMALPSGPAPADRSRERPLVGSGTDDPSRPSLAALQWHGTERLRTVTLPGRQVTVNGTGPAPADAIPRQRTGADFDSLNGSGNTSGNVSGGGNGSGSGDGSGNVSGGGNTSGNGDGIGNANGDRQANGTSAPLPRRIRQASLAPQLREPVQEPDSTAPPRTPEQARTLLSSLQQGTERGRRAARGVDAEPPADAPTVIFPRVTEQP